MRTFRDRAIVLRTYKLGEADRILVLLGEETGQFRAVAKGVRRSRSKFGSRLESFNLVDMQVYRGKELHTVTQAETVRHYAPRIAANYGAFTNAKLMVETAQRLTDEDQVPSPEQFRLLHGALHALAAADRPATLVASSYLLRSLALEGWEPTLRTCAGCGNGSLVGFSSTAGGVVCGECAPSDTHRAHPEALALVRALGEADWPAALRVPSQHWESASRMAGSFAQWHLEQRLRALPFASVQLGGH